MTYKEYQGNHEEERREADGKERVMMINDLRDQLKPCPCEKGEPMSDLIDRQQAIDVLEEQLDYLSMLNKKDNPTAESKRYGINWARNTIIALPTAEPTIDTIAERISDTTWYHINRNGKLVEGASGREEALYKAEDIFRILEEMGASDI